MTQSLTRFRSGFFILGLLAIAQTGFAQDMVGFEKILTVTRIQPHIPAVMLDGVRHDTYGLYGDSGPLGELICLSKYEHESTYRYDRTRSWMELKNGRHYYFDSSAKCDSIADQALSLRVEGKTIKLTLDPAKEAVVHAKVEAAR